jgi:hypothetical protein
MKFEQMTDLKDKYIQKKKDKLDKDKRRLTANLK